VTTGDINPARRFVRQGGTTAIVSSDVTHTVTIELGSAAATPRQREAVAWALRWHMMGQDLLAHLVTEDGWEIERVTRRDDQRETHVRFRCKPDSVEAVRQLAADAIKAVLGGGK